MLLYLHELLSSASDVAFPPSIATVDASVTAVGTMHCCCNCYFVLLVWVSVAAYAGAAVAAAVACSVSAGVAIDAAGVVTAAVATHAAVADNAAVAENAAASGWEMLPDLLQASSPPWMQSIKLIECACKLF